jgi:hypothetical protein
VRGLFVYVAASGLFRGVALVHAMEREGGIQRRQRLLHCGGAGSIAEQKGDRTILREEFGADVRQRLRADDSAVQHSVAVIDDGDAALGAARVYRKRCGHRES